MKSVIIVAGGSGKRMGLEIPKQFVEINGKPIIVYTIEAFRNIVDQIILVLPESHIQTWKVIATQFLIEDVEFTIGGDTRFQSVKNGLYLLHKLSEVVAIHDAVRPFISKKIIENSFALAQEKGSAIVSIPLNDSIRKVENDINYAVNRADYRLIQTPQCFQVELLKKAYESEEKDFFTDDASVFEYAGNIIYLTEGEHKNIKITTPIDLKIAEVFLN